jgi:hypothetical protein
MGGGEGVRDGGGVGAREGGGEGVPVEDPGLACGVPDGAAARHACIAR